MPRYRIPKTAQIDNEINKLKYNLGENEKPQDVLGKLINLGMRRIIQEILEREVQEYIGQEYYKHGVERNGHRNGYEPSDLKTAEGRLTIERPQVRGGEAPFESNTWNNIKKKTEKTHKDKHIRYNLLYILSPFFLSFKLSIEGVCCVFF